MRYRALGNESPEALHRMALNSDSYFAGEIARHRGTPTETLHYVIHKETFAVPMMVRKSQNDTEERLNVNQKKDLWLNAVGNPALGTEDLIWIYEQVTASKYDPASKTVLARSFTYYDIHILKGIGVHRNTPSELLEIVRAIRVNGNPVIRQHDFDVRDEREYENYCIDWISGKPVAPTPPPKPKSIPGALPGADRLWDTSES